MSSGQFPIPSSGGGGTWGSITGTLSNQTDLQSALDLKANLASPALTGVPTAPTASAGTSSTQVATTAFVQRNRGDMFSSLVNTEVSVTGAITASAFDTLYVCSGTTSDYAVTLPTSSGNGGKILSFRMSPALTKFVTITAAGANLIDDLATRVMHNNECATLYCDGTNWTKMAGKSIPFTSTCQYSVGGTSVYNYVASTANIVPLTVVTSDPYNLFDSGSSSIKIPRPGVYLGLASVTAGDSAVVAGALLEGSLWINGTTLLGGATSATGFIYTAGAAAAEFTHPTSVPLVQNDLVQLRVYSSVTCTSRPITGAEPHVSITEIVNW